jgi:DNA-directed RNA polymerase specialized sigma24 family protein
MGERGAKRGPGKTRALVLKYWRLGLTQAEIARVTGVSRESVRVHFKKLRESGELEEKAS